MNVMETSIPVQMANVIIQTAATRVTVMKTMYCLNIMFVYCHRNRLVHIYSPGGTFLLPISLTLYRAVIPKKRNPEHLLISTTRLCF